MMPAFKGKRAPDNDPNKPPLFSSGNNLCNYGNFGCGGKECRRCPHYRGKDYLGPVRDIHSFGRTAK